MDMEHEKFPKLNYRIYIYFLAYLRPYFIQSKTLIVKPNKNPATHWSGCSAKNICVIKGPMKNVNIE